MIRKLMAYLFGEWCDDHQRYYRSDLCPRCMKTRTYRDDVTDRRPEWLRSEGSWPTKRSKG